MSTPIVKFRRLREGAIMPTRGSDGAAGLDLYTVDMGIFRQDRLTNILHTGIGIELPPGHVGLVCSRSGLASRQKLFVLNSPGIIDEDYRGELIVILSMLPGDAAWPSWDTTVIQPGSRVAQLVIMPTPQFQVEEVSDFSATERGTNGLGSTGL